MNKLKTIYTVLTFAFITSLATSQTLLRDTPTNGAASNSIAFIDGSSNAGYNTDGANYAGKGILFPSMDLTLALGTAPFDQGAVGGVDYNPNFYDGLVVYNTGMLCPPFVVAIM